MLYSEFIEGTGCKQSDYNYKVYRDLEIMYMNSDLSKQEIYEYGKKLVDNSKSPEQIAYENNLKAQIADLKEQLKGFVAEANRYMEFHKEQPGDTYWKGQAVWQRQLARDTRRRINDLKWILQV